MLSTSDLRHRTFELVGISVEIQTCNRSYLTGETATPTEILRNIPQSLQITAGMVPRLGHNRFLIDSFQFCAMSSRNCQRRKMNYIKGNLQPETYQTIQTHTVAILACEWKQHVSTKYQTKRCHSPEEQYANLQRYRSLKFDIQRRFRIKVLPARHPTHHSSLDEIIQAV